MPDNRPAIPAGIERQVLVEAGHRCAILQCRYIIVEIHHIVPWAECQAHDYENLIALCPNCHARAGRGEIDRKSLRIYKAKLRFAHDKFSNLEMDLLFELMGKPKDFTYPLQPYLMLLVKRILDAGYVQRMRVTNVGVFITGALGNLKMDPDYLRLTDAGRSFLESLSLE